MNFTHAKPSQTGVTSPQVEDDYTFYGKTNFQHLLRIERQRTERSKKPFLLLLLDISNLIKEKPPQEILAKLNSSLVSALRETDIRGWYDHNRIIGVIFTEMSSLDEPTIEGVFSKIHNRLSEKLTGELLDKIGISFHIYPETQGQVSLNGFNIKLYPDLTKRDLGHQLSLTVKKTIDVVGSAVALLLFSPVFLVIAAAIKLTSAGPVFFRQERLGLNGKTFTLLKFRSMYTNNDPARHKDYIRKYISEQKKAAVEPGVFKLKNDLRITLVGSLLRKTSLDELPQFINVLKGEMSLVGPRPPIPYECDLYDMWHRRRLLSCKPGITGLWQVTGRSRTTFDEMVRLDLKYISEWTLWLDFHILLKTPMAVLGGKGAY
jgi:lipopolysaccharide/colanic/teichoic acid biosynthesis glycosyltransferase